MASMAGMDAGGNAQTFDVGQVKSKFQVNTSFLSDLSTKNLKTLFWLELKISKPSLG